MAYTPSGNWGVDYFQINGANDGVGESAILLLVDTAPTDNSGKKKRVISAVLIDVGLGANMIENLIATMQDIKLRYSGIPNACLQFDAIVITHWDRDHVLAMCSKGDDTYFHKPELGPCRDLKDENFGLVNSFKYSADRKTPLTRFYCQFWGGVDRLVGATKFPLDGGSPSGKDTGGGKIAPRTDPFDIRLTMFSTDKTQLKDYFKTADDAQKKKLTNLGYQTGSTQWQIPCLKGYCQPKSLLGVNVFTGDGITGEFKDVLNIGDLLTKNPPGKKWAGAPGLYIVGVQLKFLGAAFDPQTHPPDLHPHQQIVKQVFVDENGQEHPLLGVTDQVDTYNKALNSEKNPYSIVSLLIWDKSIAAPPQPVISLYTGGDAEWVTEAGLLDWLSPSSKTGAYTGTVTCIKAGHHGSKAGTSVKLIQQLQPDHVIFSAGYQYGHPVHELILYLDAWWRSKKAGTKLYGARLHSVCHPYWLVKVKGIPKPGQDPNLDKSEKPTYFRSSVVDPDSYQEQDEKLPDTDGVQKYQMALDAAYKDWKKPLDPNPLKEFKDKIGKWKKDPDRVTNAASINAAFDAYNTASEKWDDTKKLVRKAKQKKYKGPPSLTDLLKQEADDKTAFFAAAIHYWQLNFDQGWLAFQLIADSFANLWAKWSDIDYDFCPIKGQDWTKTVRYLEAEFTVDDFKIGCTQIDGNKESFDPPDVYNPRNQLAALRAVQLLEVQSSGAQSLGVQKKRPRDEAPHTNTVGYILKPKLEAIILACENSDPHDDSESQLNNAAEQSGEKEQVSATMPVVLLTASESTTSFQFIYPSESAIDATQISIDGANSLLDNFLCSLPDGMLSFDSNVVIDPSGIWSGELAKNDGLYMWLSSALPEFLASRSVILKGSVQYSSIANLRISWLFDIPDVLGSGSKTLELEYASDSLSGALGVDSSILSQRVNSQGQFLLNTGFLSGLVQSQASSAARFTLRNVFDIVNMPVPMWLGLLDGPTSVLNKPSFMFKSKGTNGIWFYPLEQLFTQMRFEIVEIGADQNAYVLNSMLGSLSFLHLGFGLCTVIAIRRQTVLQDDLDKSELSSYRSVTGELTFETTISMVVAQGSEQSPNQLSFDSYLTIKKNSIQFVMRVNYSALHGDPIDTFFQWLSGVMELPPVFDKKLLQSLPTDTTSGKSDPEGPFLLREIFLIVEHGAESLKISSVRVTFEVRMKFGLTSAENKIPFSLTFSYSVSAGSSLVSFKGSLWQLVPDSIQQLAKLNTNNPAAPLLMPIASHPQTYISIPALLAQFSGQNSAQMSTIPSAIPIYITTAEIEVSNVLMSLRGTMSSTIDDTVNVVANPTTLSQPFSADASRFPTLSLTKVEAGITYTYGPPAVFDVFFTAVVVLQPKFTLPQLNPAILNATIRFDKAAGAVTWSVEAHGQDFNAAALYSLFPNADNDAVMNVLEEISIQQFDILFTYNSLGSSKDFIASGVLMLGPVELDLKFQYDSAAALASSWSFNARLRPQDGVLDSTVGELLGGISAELAEILPDFVTSFDLEVGSQDFIDMQCSKRVPAVGSVLIVFSIIAKIGSFEFSFFQISENTGSTATRRRMLRITLDKLPSASGFPLIEKLEQPFDSMDFIWNDNDISRSDIIDVINPIYSENKVPPIVFKDPRTTSNTDDSVLDTSKETGSTLSAQPNDTAIAAGCHFIIVYEQNNIPTAILDYNFAGRPTQSPSSGQNQSPVLLVAQTQGRETASAVASGPGASATWARTIGPLSISAIKMNYEQGLQKTDPSYCTITFDAKLMLGPVSGILHGFGLRFPMTSIQKFNAADIRPMISGIGLELYRPPIAIAGMMTKSPGGYAGALSLEIEPYTFLGGGSYTQQPDKTDSVFAFAEVDGPLIELEFATLSGLIAGFGYNEQLTLPNVDNVTSFPFLVPPAQSDPLTIEQNFLSADKTWFIPMTGKDWMTAGLTAKAFHVLTVSAAIILDLDVDVIFGVFADCTATVPADAASDAERFAVADLGIVALFDYGKGIFQVEGQLTPKSFILSKDCKLTGGFALCYWFNGSGHEGDWVFTVGGYHSAFQVPSWYPKPKRLAISWPLGDVTISGDAYFAVTPKSCMGGGHLHIAYHSGDLSAWFDAFADFLINYSPFYFLASIGVSIGIKYVLKVGWVHKNFNIDFSASLNLHGPPLAGSVTVHWSIISFTIHFGNSTARNNPLSWPDFQKLLLQPSPLQSDPTKQTVETARTTSSMQAITATNGLLDSPNDGQVQIKTSTVTTSGAPPVWTVNGAIFAFSFVALFPISSIQYNSHDMIDANMKNLFNGTNDIYMKPMHVTKPATSKCIVEIREGADPNAPYRDFVIQPIVKQVPTALWGQYASASDPSRGVSPASLLNNNSDATSALVMGFDFVVPPPQNNGPYVNFPLTEMMYDCMKEVLPPPNMSVLPPKFPGIDMDLAYRQWLPDASATDGSSPSYPDGYSMDYWTGVKDAWRNPLQSVPDMVSRWCNVCGANEGVKFTSLLTDFATTSAPPTHLIDNLADVNYLPPLYLRGPPTYSVQVLAATFGFFDVTQIVSSGVSIDAARHIFVYTPDYRVLGDPDPFHAKEFNVTWRTGVSYPQYFGTIQGINPPVSWSQPNTTVIVEGHTMVVDYSKNLTFGDPEPDNNGRHIYSAFYYDADVTAYVRWLSRRSPFIDIRVDRSLYPNPPPGTARWALTVSYFTIGRSGPEYHTVVAGDDWALTIPPGVTPEPRLTIHKAMWALQDMTEEITELVTYQQTLSFNVDPGKYSPEWKNSWPPTTGRPKTWSIMYQYGDEPLQLLVAIDDGGPDSGLQTINYNQRPQPDRNLFFNPQVPNRVPGGNNILAIIWGHNRDINGTIQAAHASVYDVIGSGRFMCTNDAIGFDGGWGFGKTCHVFYQYGMYSSIQCAAAAEVPDASAKPIQSISVYNTPTAPMPGNGLFVQNPLVGGCQIRCFNTGRYLVYNAGLDGVPIIRADGMDSTKALVFKADPAVNRNSPPRVQVWDPVTQSTYQLQLDRNNDIILLQGAPVPQLAVHFEYELHLGDASPSLLLSCFSTHTINEEPFVVTHRVSDFQVRSRALRSTLYNSFVPDYVFHKWLVTWLPSSSNVGPSQAPPVKSRVAYASVTPANSSWILLICSFFIALPHVLGVTGFESESSIGPDMARKWWTSLTPLQRADISQSVAAIVSMPQPDNFAAIDLFPSRCRILWRELYEAGHLWNLLTWALMPNPTNVDPVNLFSDVSIKILKLGSEETFNSSDPNIKSWMDSAFNIWSVGHGTGFIPPGYDPVASDLSNLMLKAKTSVQTLASQQPSASPLTNEALFAATRSALNGWADIPVKVDP